MTLAGPEDNQGEVFILGAGFSRAVSTLMPLTDELGNLVVDAIDGWSDPRVPTGGFSDGRFEMWLSRLAEPQPHLRSAANLENRALFAQISEAISDVLEERQLEVLRNRAPHWLGDFLSVLHVRRPNVITLNYDNLVECGVDGHYLWDHLANERVTTHDVLNGMPTLAKPTLNSIGGEVRSTFRLLKLHGSLRWYWSPDDETGATVQRWDPPGVFGAPVEVDEEHRSRLMPGREPFIVPPASAKSIYFRNLITRELWRRAFEAIEHASRIVLLGYSLPLTDLTLVGMIEDAIRDRDVRFEIADLNASGVAERVTALGVPREHIDVLDGQDCIGAFVARYRDQQAALVVERLRLGGGIDGSAEGTLLVSWGNEEQLTRKLTFAVTGVGTADPVTGDLVLELDGERKPLAPQGSQLGELVAQAQTARQIVGLTPDGRRLPIVDLWTSQQPAGDTYRWISMVAAGRPDF